MTRFLVVVAACFFSSFGLAQSGLEAFCRGLLNLNVRDEANLFSTSQSFDLVRTILFDQNELQYSAAQTLQASLSIPIIDVIDVTLGGETTEENWTSRRNTFFNDVLNASTVDQTYKSEISRINNAFFASTDRCIDALAVENQEAFFPLVTMRSYRQFDVDIVYRINPENPRPLTVNIDAFPAEGLECRPTLPFRISAGNQTRTIRCVKPEEEPVFLTVRSDTLGDKGSFDLPGGGILALVRRDVDELSARVASLTPIARGTVAAFNLAACPTGWSSFSEGIGRTIVGVGDSVTEGITSKALMQNGGAETVTLTVEQMPSHGHVLTLPGRAGNNAFVNRPAGWGNDDDVRVDQAASTSATGGSQAHENMPPYVALLFCQKN